MDGRPTWAWLPQWIWKETISIWLMGYPHSASPGTTWSINHVRRPVPSPKPSNGLDGRVTSTLVPDADPPGGISRRDNGFPRQGNPSKVPPRNSPAGGISRRDDGIARHVNLAERINRDERNYEVRAARTLAATAEPSARPWVRAFTALMIRPICLMVAPSTAATSSATI